ncbi:GNAT family N-acetyltransferase [Nostocoides veronense]|uniref:GNAT family N-acetyltransferase n=1 Tax=Nostocoides veronense TaxID=330836 RepID=A0ABN2L9Q3_9MICO
MTHVDPIVRPATTDDAPALAELFWQIRQECVPQIPMIVHPRDTVEPFLRGQIETATTWVAQVGGDLIGFLVLSEPDHLDHLYLRREHTGSGLGSCLLELAKDTLPGGLQLWAFQANVSAIRFYERHGFTQVAWTDGDNDEGAPDVLMVWSGSSPGPRLAGRTASG